MVDQRSVGQQNRSSTGSGVPQCVCNQWCSMKKADSVPGSFSKTLDRKSSPVYKTDINTGVSVSSRIYHNSKYMFSCSLARNICICLRLPVYVSNFEQLLHLLLMLLTCKIIVLPYLVTTVV